MFFLTYDLYVGALSQRLVSFGYRLSATGRNEYL